MLAYNAVQPVKKTDTTTQEQAPVTREADTQSSENKQTDEPSIDQSTPDSTVSSPGSNATPQSPGVVTTQPQQATNSAPQQATPPSAPVAPSCNESMRASYTDLYNAQVASENANWSSRVSGWQSEAASRNMSFSGYVQSKINENKPAHDARLAQIQAQYQQNLLSINCG